MSLTRNDGPPTVNPGHRKLSVAGLYQASATASTDVSLGGTATPGADYAQLLVSGSAVLAGRLTVTLDAEYTPATGDSFTIIVADSVSGRFQHADDIITAEGHQFRINYGAQEVTLE